MRMIVKNVRKIINYIKINVSKNAPKLLLNLIINVNHAQKIVKIVQMNISVIIVSQISIYWIIYVFNHALISITLMMIKNVPNVLKMLGYVPKILYYNVKKALIYITMNALKIVQKITQEKIKHV